MSDVPNEKTQIDRSGLTINTDPDADTRRLAAKSAEVEEQKGVRRVGGGDAGKINRGVKRVSRS